MQNGLEYWESFVLESGSRTVLNEWRLEDIVITQAFPQHQVVERCNQFATFMYRWLQHDILSTPIPGTSAAKACIFTGHSWTQSRHHRRRHNGTFDQLRTHMLLQMARLTLAPEKQDEGLCKPQGCAPGSLRASTSLSQPLNHRSHHSRPDG
jgi:hypothetical protein